MRRIVFVIYEGFQTLDLTGPYEVFDYAGRLAGGGYACQTVAAEAGPVRVGGVGNIAHLGVLRAGSWLVAHLPAPASNPRTK